MATVEVHFSALPAHLRTARLIAAAVARRCGVPEGALDEVRLAVGEACGRAVGLHQAHAPEVPVTLLLADEDSQFSVTVIDVGPPGAEVAASEDEQLLIAPELVDADRLRAPAGHPLGGPAPDLLPAGFGLAVIAGLVDDVRVDVAPDGGGGTSVRMAWPREPTSQGSEAPTT